MNISEVFQLISTQGLSIVLVIGGCYALYRITNVLWGYFREREQVKDEKERQQREKEDLKEKRQEEREEKILKALDDSNKIILETNSLNKELSETNKTLVDKLTLDVVEIKHQVVELNNAINLKRVNSKSTTKSKKKTNKKE